jgi:hypothetical protein
MDQIRRVEELGNGGVDVLLRFVHGFRLFRFLGIVGEIELLAAAGIGAVVLHELVLTLPVLLCEDL